MDLGRHRTPSGHGAPGCVETHLESCGREPVELREAWVIGVWRREGGEKLLPPGRCKDEGRSGRAVEDLPCLLEKLEGVLLPVRGVGEDDIEGAASPGIDLDGPAAQAKGPFFAVRIEDEWAELRPRSECEIVPPEAERDAHPAREDRGPACPVQPCPEVRGRGLEEELRGHPDPPAREVPDLYGEHIGIGCEEGDPADSLDALTAGGLGPAEGLEDDTPGRSGREVTGRADEPDGRHSQQPCTRVVDHVRSRNTGVVPQAREPAVIHFGLDPAVAPHVAQGPPVVPEVLLELADVRGPAGEGCAPGYVHPVVFQGRPTVVTPQGRQENHKGAHGKHAEKSVHFSIPPYPDDRITHIWKSPF